MDSKILVAVFDSDEIVYVNPFCKKQNVKIQGSKSPKVIAEDNRSLDLTIDSFCNAPFKFEVFTWESPILIEQNRKYAHTTPPLPESAKDNFYPPPRV
ncbi:hypothetical protein LZ575_11245 [Antarcticibacterium sp. 1MA-6-2]|uniref:hypothetical protein n=1 Tax=Antarcticibacterium sp. 1MA-6-2 TaxID=2908210 RepID=UPI001F2F8667|nr:hypothetical protein [Antarcticibacterium sp. 1MA-6-2]UJH89661.1 hypothetical protein LZ575_11245 [Antarcticibacterium sp. 1MA-6-2]